MKEYYITEEEVIYERNQILTEIDNTTADRERINSTLAFSFPIHNLMRINSSKTKLENQILKRSF